MNRVSTCMPFLRVLPGGFSGGRKICALYFKICLTYFEICQTYFFFASTWVKTAENQFSIFSTENTRFPASVLRIALSDRN